jgi:hypothetical protein
VLAPGPDQAFDPVLASRLCRGSSAFVLIEAGAIVLKDVKPWMIVVGNPARESKRREITQ